MGRGESLGRSPTAPGHGDLERRHRIPAAPRERWRISVSGRHDDSSEFANSDSIRLATHFQWRDDTLFWAAVGTGIKQPSFVERYGYTPDSFIGNPDLEAEENEHVSVGAEYRRGPWQHGLTLYRDHLADEINGFLFDPDLGGFTAGNDDGTSKRHGIEWSSARDWTGGTLRVARTTSTVRTSTAPGRSGGPSGRRSPRSSSAGTASRSTRAHSTWTTRTTWTSPPGRPRS